MADITARTLLCNHPPSSGRHSTTSGVYGDRVELKRFRMSVYGEPMIPYRRMFVKRANSFCWTESASLRTMHCDRCTHEMYSVKEAPVKILSADLLFTPIPQRITRLR